LDGVLSSGTGIDTVVVVVPLLVRHPE